MKNTLTGDYKIHSKLSGVVDSFEIVNEIYNYQKEMECPICNAKIDVSTNYNYEYYIENVKVLSLLSFCNKCNNAFEFSFIYNDDFKKLTSYVKKNKLMVFNDSNYIHNIH